MNRLLWIGPERVDPEEELAPLRGWRPSPEPLTYAEASVEAVARFLPEVVLVDARSSPTEAESVIRKLRPESDASFLVLLNESSLSDFDWSCGASDFILPSCSPEELKARLTRLTKPVEQPSGDVIRRGEVTINRERFEVKLKGEVLDLTFKEFELLAYLASRPGKVCSRSALLSEVWGYDFFGGTRTVDVHVRRLRAKLGQQAHLIETVRNVGYRFSG